MPKTAITTPGGRAIGPYSLAIASGDYVHISGQIPIDGATGKLVEGDITAQARQCMENLKAIRAAAGLGFENVVKTTIFLMDLGNFGAVNEVYKSYLAEPYPARSTIQVAGLPMAARIEIEMIAYRGK